MVYCGKPSKGCSSCRERKVRCDQKEPTCGQCERRQQTCPGYRNIVDLMFRDESNHVIKKATRTNRRGGVKKMEAATAAAAASRPSASSIRAFSSSSSVMTHNVKKTSIASSSASSSTHTDGVAEPFVKLEEPTTLTLPSLPPPNPNPGPVKATSFLAMLTPSSGPPSSSAGADSSDDSEATIDIPASALTRLAPGYPLTKSLQERGTAFFFSRYVAVDFGCYQNYDFVYDVWKPPNSDLHRVDCVTASMAAVGLAGLSKVTRCGNTMIKARQSYGTALQLTNNALRDPDTAVKDSTMLSVLILGTFEFITGRTPQTMRAWQDHVNGAAALTRARGTLPFTTKAGLRMFLMLCHSVLISCIQGGLPMPAAMLDLRRELGQYTNTRDPTWRIVEPICRALQIRYDIKNGTLANTDEIVARLGDVEAEFQDIVREMPRSWRYRCAQVNRPNSAILGSWCHIYPGFAQATTWNGMRTMRILVQETILEQLCSSMARTSVPPMRHQVMLVKAMRMLELLGEAVIASTPQHFGIVSARDAKPDVDGQSKGTLEFVSATRPPQPLASACPIPSPRRPARNRTPESPVTSPRATLLDPTQSDDGRGDPERFMTLASASNTIVWPLYTLGMSSSCTRETRQYIIDRLHAIWTETGLDQARMVKQLLLDKVETVPWEGIPMLSLPEISDESLPLTV